MLTKTHFQDLRKRPYRQISGASLFEKLKKGSVGY